MTNHRASYWKAVAITATVLFIDLILLSWLLGKGLANWGTWPLLCSALWLVACLGLSCGVAVAALVLAGGLISLHRDALEARGLPYAPRRPLEWRAGTLMRGLRAAVRTFRGIWGLRPGQLDLRAGELVMVRRLEDILKTLDDQGKRDALPFMPEMAAWCGRQARVLRRVDKVYDWIYKTSLRRMWDTVLLEECRCDGRAHGRCQADCQLMWKEIWLQRPSKRQMHPAAQATPSAPQLTLDRLTQRADDKSGETRYICQMTQWPKATKHLGWHDPRHFLRDLLSGNVRASSLFVGTVIALFNSVQRHCAGAQFPKLTPASSRPTPHAVLDLRPGELVRIKSKREIENTLDSHFKNRGLWFAPDMLRFCGGEHLVRARVNRQIEEKSGKMIIMANPCIVLEGVPARGEYLVFAVLNERAYWREIWLERKTV
jgi:hypothetical protein